MGQLDDLADYQLSAILCKTFTESLSNAESAYDYFVIIYFLHYLIII